VHVRSRDGVWEAVCYYYDGTKRVRTRRSTGVKDDGTAKSKRTAEITAADIERSLALGVNRRSRTETIAQAFNALVTKKQQAGRSPDTIEIVLEKAKNVLEFFGPDRRADSFTDKDLQDYCLKNAHRAPGTLHRELLEMRQAIKAVGLVPPKAPVLAIDNPRERWLPEAEFQKMIQKAPETRHDYLYMYRLAALSRSELYKINPAKGDVDFKANAFRVRGSKTKYRDRWIPMHPVVREILKRRIKSAGPLFPRWQNIYRELKAIAEAAGIERFNLNDLRRSFATSVALAGRSPLELKPLMGHSPNSRVLDKHYARLQGRQLGAVVADLGAFKRASSKPPARVKCVPETDDTEGSADASGTSRRTKKPKISRTGS
jgi:integrase